ncbi:MAG: hypothetical protein AB7P69_03170 [Candidatus Binatia bacterium]
MKEAHEEWLDMLMAHWSELSGTVRLRLNAYLILSETTQRHGLHSGPAEIQSLEDALKNAAHGYGWKEKAVRGSQLLLRCKDHRGV